MPKVLGIAIGLVYTAAAIVTVEALIRLLG